MRCSFFLSSRISICSGVIGEALGVLPWRSSRSCLTHLVIVERPTSIALAASATVYFWSTTSWADSRLNSALKFLFFIGAPVLFWGEHITSVQVAKFSVPLHWEAITKQALGWLQWSRRRGWVQWSYMAGWSTGRWSISRITLWLFWSSISRVSWINWMHWLSVWAIWQSIAPSDTAVPNAHSAAARADILYIRFAGGDLFTPTSHSVTTTQQFPSQSF